MDKKMIYVVFMIAIIILGVCSAWFLIRNQDLQSQVDSFDEEKTQLQTSIADLQNQITIKDTEIANLNEELNTLKAPNLMNIGTGASDHREGDSPYLHVYGHVGNIGSETAFNAKIHVTADHINGETAIDTYITMGQLPGISEGSIYVLQQFLSYDGTNIDISTVKIIPEWTNEP